MGHRLSKIYTRTGDGGETGLGDGRRLSKDHPRLHVLGDLDELSSVLGLVRCELPAAHASAAALRQVQQELLDLGGEMACPGLQLLDSAAITRLEQEMDALNAELGPLQEFILPGGTRAAASAHLARATARRLERQLVALAQEEALPDLALAYINRLSDWLFVMARQLGREEGDTEILWRHERR